MVRVYKHKISGKHEKTNVKFNLSRFKWSNSFVYYYILLKKHVLDSRKDTQLSKFTFKRKKASKIIVHSYVLMQMFLSLKCCRKKIKVKLQ